MQAIYIDIYLHLTPNSDLLRRQPVILNDNHITIASHLQELANKWTQEAKTLVWFADSTQAIAAIALTDEIKQTSAQAISQLQEMGVEVL